MIRIAFRNFLTACRAHAGFFLLSLFCLISAFVSLLHLQQSGYYQYKESISRRRETQILYLACEDSATIRQVVTQLSHHPELPKAAVLTVSDGQFCGLFWDRGLKPDVWYTPYGRFFSMDEMEGGAKVVLLGTAYLGQLPFEEMESIWDSGIALGGASYTVIGNHFFEWESTDIPEDVCMTEPLCAPIVLPLETFWDSGLSVTRLRCEFSDPITSEQRAILVDLFNTYPGIHSLSIPNTSNSRAFTSYLGGMASSTLIVLLALITLVNILLYWLRHEFERYRIYRICGAGRGQILRLLLLQILFLITLAYLCAYGIARVLISIMPDGFASPLPVTLYVGIYLLSLLLITAIAVAKAYPRILHRGILNP